MEPLIRSGERVKLEPVLAEDLESGDIVLVRVQGRVYLHFIKTREGSRFQIGNNQGHSNG